MKRCEECREKKWECRPFISYADGTLGWICKPCWNLHGYGPYFHRGSVFNPL